VPRIVRRPYATVLVVALAFAAACDDDPNDPNPNFSVTCPAQSIGVDQPIVFTVNGPVAAASVNQGNVVVSEAVTGVEVPGALSFDAAAGQSSITFTPSAQLAFRSTFRVRVQNLTTTGNVPLQSVVVCDVVTPPPPITELFWRPLPSAGGGSLRGGSLPTSDVGYVAQLVQPFFRRDNAASTEFVALPNIPYYTNFFDLSFVDVNRGFATLGEPRESRSLIGETADGGATFSVLANVGNQALTRMYFRRVAAGEAGIFGVAGGGRLPTANLFKYNSQTRTFATLPIGNTSQVADIDFATDTLKGVANTFGVQVGLLDFRGVVARSSDGGSTWTVIPNSVAPADVVSYVGVAIRNNGEIFTTGANGYVAKLTPGTTAGTYTITRVLQNVIPNLDPTNNLALQYTDVEFLPNNDLKGWVIGLQQTGVQNGIPRLRGLIFETRDGGNTWTRQGVPGAPDFGAEFPALNRILISPDGARVWLVGEGGTVLEYHPTTTP